jgi:hypothetical protein
MSQIKKNYNPVVIAGMISVKSHILDVQTSKYNEKNYFSFPDPFPGDHRLQ